MDDPGEPTSYLELPEGVPVISSEGDEVGVVEHVLADEEADIFDGLIIDVDGGHRFADASLVGRLHERAAFLNLSTAECEALPEPSENPAVLEAGPDAVESATLQDRLKRAWDYLSGNY
jgi:hypothetical protein